MGASKCRIQTHGQDDESARNENMLRVWSELGSGNASNPVPIKSKRNQTEKNEVSCQSGRPESGKEPHRTAARGFPGQGRS
jgi:hypothetical protein